jgi:Cu(I)/Ag(I) efflux system membrane fusion protein
MSAEITFPYWPAKEFKGRITVLSPFLDPQTRTLRARLEVPNAAFELRPEMFGTARIAVDLGDRLVVPEGAVMRTGERAYAFRAADGDRIEPVEVTLGVRAEGAWEVLNGLKAGDRVVSSANFLVDSESSLKAALQAVAGR